MYAIRCFCHRTDISMGAHGFAIDIRDKFRQYVERSELTQQSINTMIERVGNIWLDCCGFDHIYDPDDDRTPLERHKSPSKKHGPNASRLYEARSSIRVQWGEWGPEHISVPGNACGLDIERSRLGSVFDDGIMLTPHNVDSLHQKYLLTIVFTEIAESILLLGRETK